MSRLREIKARIYGIREIEEITNAVKLVAVVRLKNLESKVLQGREYAQKIKELAIDVFKSQERREQREGGSGLLVISSQTGLCGGFNERVKERTEEFIHTHSISEMIVVGRKGVQYFKRKGYPLIKEYSAWQRGKEEEVSKQVARDIFSLYQQRRWKKVYFIYSKFRDSKEKVEICKLLPLQVERVHKEEFLFEPFPERIIEELLPQYILAQIRQGLGESRCAEEWERIRAMEYASENADKLVEELSREFNRARQNAITREIYG